MSDEPEIFSSGTAHEVHLPEGSHTAVSKTATAMEPQIRKTAANHEETVEVIEVVKGVTHNQVEEERLAQLAQAGSKIEKARAAPLAQATVESATTAQEEGTATQDRFAQIPEGQEEAPRMAHAEVAAAEEDKMAFVQDKTEAAQMAHAVDAGVQPEHLVSEDNAPTPNNAPNTALPLDQVMSDLPSLDLNVPDTAASPEPTPAAQETAPQTDTSLPEVEVAAPAEFMAEMNFPARVVKLKIANDQIRGQIDKLEKPLFAPIPVEAPAPAKAKGKEKKEADKKPAKGH